MKKIESKIQNVAGSTHCCSGKNCDSEGYYFLKLSVTSLGGWFCKGCAAELKESGILEEVKSD